MRGRNDGDEVGIGIPNTPCNTVVDDTTVLETGEVKTGEGELMLSHETGEVLQVAKVLSKNEHLLWNHSYVHTCCHHSVSGIGQYSIRCSGGHT